MSGGLALAPIALHAVRRERSGLALASLVLGGVCALATVLVLVALVWVVRGGLKGMMPYTGALSPVVGGLT